MDTIQQIGNFLMNHGMAAMITIYMLWRDWKYQGQIITLMGKLDSALDNFANILERMRNNE